MSTAVFLLLFIVGFYALFDIHFIQVSAQMDDEIARLAPDDAGIDIAALRDINPEIQAWIKINDTKIDYPIVQAKDNIKYLTRNYRGDYATAGSIFLDYRNDGFNDDFSLVYGHRMDGQQVFGGILQFEDADYFNSHKTGVLYTADATYDLEISDFAVIDVSLTTIYRHDQNRNDLNDRIISEIHSFAHQSRDIEYNENDKIIVLSTCDKDAKHYRNVLLAKMIKRD
jgi:sortase B